MEKNEFKRKLFAFKCCLLHDKLCKQFESRSGTTKCQNVGPDLDSNCLTLFLRDFLKKVNIEKWQIVRTRKYNVLISLQYRIALDT